MNKIGFVYLIGAGPGDQGLITIKGMEVLKRADVILYDNLVAVSLLNQIKPDAQLIYTGKRSGQHSMKQAQINELLVEKAKEGFVVARLKGGDPFIFGRGGEEVLELGKQGIDYEVIPGISSSYAVPAYAGIPVTHRGLASSFHVITGHEDEAKASSSLDYSVLAAIKGTLIFLMGLKNLPHITEMLIRYGKSPKTPAAVIEKGTTAGQKMAAGTLENIVNLVQEKGLKTPAIIVIGETAGLHKYISWFGRKPLSGKSVLITATDEISQSISEKVSAFGAQPWNISLIQTISKDVHRLEQKMNEIHNFTWIILTSRNGVRIFFEQLKLLSMDIRKMANIRFAVIGHGTKEALAQHGIYADFVPTAYTSSSLGKELVPMLGEHDRLLLLRASAGSKVLTKMLDDAHIAYVDLPIYDTQIDVRKKELLQRAYGDADYVTFCSPSAVEAFAEMMDLVDIKQTSAGKIICIGPVTAKAAGAAGLPVYKTADVYDADGLVSCILQIEESEHLWN